MTNPFIRKLGVRCSCHLSGTTFPPILAFPYTSRVTQG